MKIVKLRPPISLAILLMIGLFTPLDQASAGQHQNGSAYIWWDGIKLSANSSITQSIEVKKLSPRMYWSSAWHWANDVDGGYGGIQTLGYFGGDIWQDVAIFSIWNATEGIPGEGGNCIPFGGEGVGYSCKLPVDLVPGNTYTMTYAIDKKRGLDWWKATITDKAKAETRLIGTIHATKSKLISADWYNFIEYWGDEVACDAVGLATARFYLPISSSKSAKPVFTAFMKPSKPCVKVAADAPKAGTPGNVLMRFGGAYQAPSTTISKSGKNKK